MTQKEKQDRFNWLVRGVLSDREQDVLRRRHGVDTGEHHTCEEVGQSGLFGKKVTRQMVSFVQLRAEEKLGEKAVREIRKMFPAPPSSADMKRSDAILREAIVRHLQQLPASEPINFDNICGLVGLDLDQRLNLSEIDSCWQLFLEFGIRDFVKYKVCGYGDKHVAPIDQFYQDKNGRRASICKTHNSRRCVEFQRNKRKSNTSTSLPRAA